MIENSLWVEKFRPTSLDGYIGNEMMVAKFKAYISSDDVPHLLLYGPAGTGKTTACKILASSIDADVLYINASDENNVDTVRDKIKGFASTAGFSKWKIIICDEFDFFTVNAMAALRNLMETFSKTTRFLLTCNYVEKIIPAIRSRCQEFEIYPPNKAVIAKRLSHIISESNVEFDKKDLVNIINTAYPDIRKAINIAQNSVINNKLVIDKNEKLRLSYMDDLLEELKSKNDLKAKFKNIRQILADSKVRDFTTLYRFLFDHLDDFAQGHVASVILVIADAQYKDSMVVDKEINIASMFVQILNELNN